MYSACLFCTASLGANEVIEHLPVGRRLAYDAANGRLWVVCGWCGQWNLSPIEDRWEAIEECDRRFRVTFSRVSTDNVALARLAEGLEIVRIGSPLRPEFAAWRYAARFAMRRTRAHAIGGSAIAAAALTAIVLGPALLPALSAGALSIVLVPGITSVMGVIPVVSALAVRDYVQHDRVISRFVRPDGVATVRAKHLSDIRLTVDSEGQPALNVIHDRGWTNFEGSRAIQATGILLAGANRYGASPTHVQHAVRKIEGEGNAHGFVQAAAKRCGWRGGRMMSVMNKYRELGAMHMDPIERLALEMAVHEESEWRAMRGELHLLEDAWRDAERIAQISDGMLTPAVAS